MTRIKWIAWLLTLASLTLCGCEQRRAPAAVTPATNHPALAAPKMETTATNLVEVTLTGRITRAETVFSKTGGQERKLIRYMLVTVDGDTWALQAVAAREVLSQLVGRTATIKGLARGHLVKRIAQIKPVPADSKTDTPAAGAPDKP